MRSGTVNVYVAILSVFFYLSQACTIPSEQGVGGQAL
jgi:hypothetical protein